MLDAKLGTDCACKQRMLWLASALAQSRQSLPVCTDYFDLNLVMRIKVITALII